VPPTNPGLTTLGRLLRAYRTEARLTQEALGSRTGLARNYIGQVERGEANISYVSISQWLAAVRVTWRRLGAELDDDARGEFARGSGAEG
jgi:transcriptional regulator with XRE-family HTH domain